MPKLKGLAAQFTIGRNPGGERAGGSSPFHVLLFADFSGAGKPATAARTFEPVRVDIEKFDAVMARISPTVSLESSVLSIGGPVTFKFTSLDDFHPDHLFERCEHFAALRTLRRELLDPRTYALAAARILPTAPPSPAPAVATAPTQSAGEAHDDTVARLLGKRPAAAAAPVVPVAEDSRSALDAWIRSTVAPHVTRGLDPRAAELVAALDERIADLMREVLHHPQVQALEATWRGLDFLVRRLDPDAELQLGIVDVSRHDLVRQLATGDVRSTPLYQLLSRRPDDVPYALALFDWSLGRTALDAALLSSLAEVAQATHVPALVGTSAVDEILTTPPAAVDPAWTALRELPAAQWLGAVGPGVMLRLPYGPKTDKIDRFAFEENPVPPRTDRYLWGSGVLAVAAILGDAYRSEGWRFGATPSALRDLEDLPLHVYTLDGESTQSPCVQRWLHEAEVERLVAAGIMPIVSIRGRNTLRLVRLQALASP